MEDAARGVVFLHGPRCLPGTRAVPSVCPEPLLKAQGRSLGEIAAKTGIPKTSLHRYLANAAASRR